MTKKKPHARMGRPPVKAENRRSKFVTVRFTQGEYRQVAADAKNAGQTVAEYLRFCWQERR